MPRMVDTIFKMDREKLLKTITSGITLAIMGLAIMVVSNTVRNGLPSLANALGQENSLNFWSSFYGYAEYAARAAQLNQAQYWIVATCYFIKAVGQVALLLGILFALLGFLGSAFNKDNEDKVRLVCLIAGCVLLFVVFYGMLNV
jgi:hypothetical protein